MKKAEKAAPRKPVTILGRRFSVPQSRLGRLGLGWALIAGGILGFLPILGFWMIPLGLFVLSVDSPMLRRQRRLLATRVGRWRRGGRERETR